MLMMSLMTFFRTPVHDAVEEWEERFPAIAENADMKKDGTFSDNLRSHLLQELRSLWFLNFEGWRAEEVLVFLFKTYPREELVRLTKSGNTSAFLEQVHDDWKPRFVDWMHVLWRFSGRSHEFFADIVFLLPPSQKAPEAETGRVLFRELIWQKILPEGACASLTGTLIQWPRESTLGLRHAKEIYHLAKELSSVEAGFLCRSLVMFRAMAMCTCGYARNEPECVCGKMDLRFDLDQDYVTILFQKILSDHEPNKVVVEDRWNEEQAEEFLRSACEYVFSDLVYKEIVHDAMHGKKTNLKQNCPRPLTNYEKKHQRARDCKAHMAEHNNCVHSGCPQMIKTGCTNLSCKTHCTSHGMEHCHTHRFYTPKAMPTYPSRRSIRQHH